MNPQQQLELEALKNRIRATELHTLLSRYSMKVLSLDCFDTLIWRKTAEPTDIFFELQHHPVFAALNLTASMRIQAEKKASQMQAYKKNHSEVTLQDIYLAFDPSLREEQLIQLATAELSIEIQHCYALPVFIDLIRAAHQQGIKIIVVSNTYFTENQLKTLLAAVLPDDVIGMIDKIFSSCSYLCSKSQGLFQHALNHLRTDAQNILHIGDQLSADFIAPRLLNLQALHFIQQEEPIQDLLRLQSMAAQIVNPSVRHIHPLWSPFRGLLATNQSIFTQPESFIGYASLGPLLYAFSHFIKKEINQLQQLGKKPRVLFLMRDGFLPSLACEALQGAPFGYRVRISRFAALAASFRSEDDIDRYLVNHTRSTRFHDIARQLLLPEKVSDPLIKTAERSPQPVAVFHQLLHRKDIVKIIINKSKEYWEKLKRYLEKETQLQQGDTLLFVDLGYSGTAQQQLTPLLKEMNIDVRGCYLLALRTPGWEMNRSGLFDPSWCDERTLRMLVVYIALLEQLCTANESSVTHYDEEGNAIFSHVKMQEQQQTGLVHIQSECIRFISEANNFSSLQSLSHQVLREIALHDLSRLLFFPTDIELRFLASFQFDLNLGTDDIYQLFDAKKGLNGLKKRGLFYMEKNSNTKRINYPAELRSASFELALTLMVQNRFNLDIKPRDMLQQQDSIQALLWNGTQCYPETVFANATHQGYFSLCVPAGSGASLKLGEKYQWLQIDCAELIKLDAFINQSEGDHAIDATAFLSFEYMTQKSNRLYECHSPMSSLLLTPSSTYSDYVFRLTFRPLVKRQLKQEFQINI